MQNIDKQAGMAASNSTYLVRYCREIVDQLLEEEYDRNYLVDQDQDLHRDFPRRDTVHQRDWDHSDRNQ